MPFRKLPEKPWSGPEDYCKHPEHEPPTMRVLEPGTYEWTCPACGAARTVCVPSRGVRWDDCGGGYDPR